MWTSLMDTNQKEGLLAAYFPGVTKNDDDITAEASSCGQTPSFPEKMLVEQMVAHLLC